MQALIEIVLGYLCKLANVNIFLKEENVNFLYYSSRVTIVFGFLNKTFTIVVSLSCVRPELGEPSWII